MNVGNYLQKLAMCSITFQFIEEVLKIYIHKVDKAIHEKMKGFIHYEVAEKELFKQSLGSLIIEFDKRTDKKDIVSSLKELAQERNYFIHQGYLLTSKTISGEKDLDEQYNRLVASHKKANKCFESLIRESYRLSGEKFPEETLKQFLELT